MQDNLEFLQWLKRFWDMNFPGGEYDAVARRGAAGAGAGAGAAGGGPRAPSAAGASARAPVAAARRPARAFLMSLSRLSGSIPRPPLPTED